MSKSRPRPRFDPTVNYYQILDVSAGASREEITRAYRALMRHTHPDAVRDPDKRARAEERAKLLNQAYAVLSRPEVRREYDEQLRATALNDALMQRYSGTVPGRSGVARTPPRPPSPHVVRAQRAAYRSAVRQLMLSTTAFVLVLAAVVVAGLVLWALVSSVAG